MLGVRFCPYLLLYIGVFVAHTPSFFKSALWYLWGGLFPQRSSHDTAWNGEQKVCR